MFRMLGFAYLEQWSIGDASSPRDTRASKVDWIWLNTLSSCTLVVNEVVT